MKNRYTWRTFSREFIALILAAITLIPLYLLLVVALKPSKDLFTSAAVPPIPPQWGNFATAWENAGEGGLGNAMLSSAIITLGSVAFLVVLGSLCSWVLARRPGRLSNSLYILFLLGIILPFQLSIIPLYVGLRALGLVGTYAGMILLWTGVMMPLAVFLYTGFVRQLPPDYEEAARMDGAGTFRVFLRVVFPLLRPITGTVAILTGLFIWNDFFASLIFLSGTDHQTLPVAIYSFVGEYVTQWNFVFAAVVIALVPIVAFFIVAQRQMIRGFAGGIRG